MRKWNDPEIAYLEKYWSLKTAKEIGDELKFTPSAVSSMASKLGLKKARGKRHELQRRALLLGKYSFHHQYLDALAKGDGRLIDYTTRPAMLGGQAERRFQFLVPEAINANKEIAINNPDYDFIYKGMKIDVKYSSASKRCDSHSDIWSVRTSGNHDLIVAFLERQRGEELNNPYVLIVPNQVSAPRKKIEIHKGGKWWRLAIEENDLCKMLDEYAKVLV